MKNIIQKSKILCAIALLATVLFVGVAADAAIGSPMRHGHYVSRPVAYRVAYRHHGYRGSHRGYRGYRAHRGYRGYRGYRGHRGYRGYRGGYRGCRGRC